MMQTHLLVNYVSLKLFFGIKANYNGVDLLHFLKTLTPHSSLAASKVSFENVPLPRVMPELCLGIV